MLTEEQIQRLAKKIACGYGFDGEECKEHILFIVNLSEIALILLDEDKKELFKKAFEGGFFEHLIEHLIELSFRPRAEIAEIVRGYKEDRVLILCFKS